MNIISKPKRPLGGGGNNLNITNPRTHNKKLKYPAFTLAEVLITLGIIGIVAALTLPTIIANNKKKEVSSRLKKFYSSLNQAVLLSEIDNGDYRYWDFSSDGLTDEDDNKNQNVNAELCEKFFIKYIAKYLKYVKYEKGVNTSNDEGTQTILKTNRVFFADGSIVYLNFGDCADYIIDVNGEKKPNEYGYDRFMFNICPEGLSTKLNLNEKVSAYAGGSNINTYEKALSKCKEAGARCTRLLQLNNWEIPDDYPYNIR